MKNVRFLREVPDVMALFPDRFHAEPVVQSLCRAAVKDRPVFLADQTHPVEAGHFGTFFGCIYDHEYSDPTMRALYLFHELHHHAHMEYRTDWTWHQWFQKMMRSEFNASLFSEALVYFYMPGLRKEAFKHEIWVDRYLETRNQYPSTGWVPSLIPSRLVDSTKPSQPPKYGNLPSDIQTHINWLAAERHRAMTAPDPTDYLELQIANYIQQNVAWARCWSDVFRQVETHMADMQALGWSDNAVQQHLAWLEARSTLAMDTTVSNRGHSVPFYDQAHAFVRKYHETKGDYGNDLLLK